MRDFNGLELTNPPQGKTDTKGLSAPVSNRLRGRYRFALLRRFSGFCEFGGFRSFATASIAASTLATAARMNWARLLGPTRASIRSAVPFGNRTGMAGSNPNGGRPMRAALSDT